MTTNVCTDCLIDRFLAQKLSSSSTPGKCDVCRRNESNIVDFNKLIELVHEAIEFFYSQTSNEPSEYEYYMEKDGDWEQKGDSINGILESHVISKQCVAEDILQALEQAYGVSPQESSPITYYPYDNEAKYEDQAVRTAIAKIN